MSEDTEQFINNIISDAAPLSVSLDEIKKIIQSVNTKFWDRKILLAFYRVRNEIEIVKIKVLLREKVWWPGIDQDV